MHMQILFLLSNRTTVQDGTEVKHSQMTKVIISKLLLQCDLSEVTESALAIDGNFVSRHAVKKTNPYHFKLRSTRSNERATLIRSWTSINDVIMSHIIFDVETLVRYWL